MLIMIFIANTVNINICAEVCATPWNRGKDRCQALKEKAQQLYQAVLHYLGVKETAKIFVD